MSDKSIIYRGEKQKAEEIIKKADNCTTMHIITDDGDRSIAGYLTQDAKNIRDEVCIMQGRLEILCKGLDKSSEKKKEYEGLLNSCIQFLSATKPKDEE